MGGEHREKYKSLQRQGDSGRGTQREIPVSTETGRQWEGNREKQVSLQRQWEGNTERNTSLYRDRETVGGEHKEKYPSLQRQGDNGRGTQREIPVSTETGRQWEGNTERNTRLYRD